MTTKQHCRKYFMESYTHLKKIDAARKMHEKYMPLDK
jgi:hypothetical protein